MYQLEIGNSTVLGSGSYRQLTLCKPLTLTSSHFLICKMGIRLTRTYAVVKRTEGDGTWESLRCAVQMSAMALPDQLPGLPLCKEHIFTQVEKYL